MYKTCSGWRRSWSVARGWESTQCCRVSSRSRLWMTQVSSRTRLWSCRTWEGCSEERSTICSSRQRAARESRAVNQPSNDNALGTERKERQQTHEWSLTSTFRQRSSDNLFVGFAAGISPLSETYVAFLFQISAHFNARHLKVFGHWWLMIATRLVRRNCDVCWARNFLHHKLLHRWSFTFTTSDGSLTTLNSACFVFFL